MEKPSDEEIFKEEDEFFCGVCGKEIKKYEEIEDEMCNECSHHILK